MYDCASFIPEQTDTNLLARADAYFTSIGCETVAHWLVLQE
jgi:hypothetical protein